VPTRLVPATAEGLPGAVGVAEPDACVPRAMVLVAVPLFVLVLTLVLVPETFATLVPPVAVVRASGVGVALVAVPAVVAAALVARPASVGGAVPVGRLLARGVGVPEVVMALVVATGCVVCAGMTAPVGVADAAGVAGVAVLLELPPHAASTATRSNARHANNRRERTNDIRRALLDAVQ